MANEDDLKCYALRASLLCHSSDIRCVSCLPNGGFVTGSRDNTSKAYLPDKKNELMEAQYFTDASHYISSVCVVQSVATNETLIYVGSNDAIIYCYSLNNSQTKYRLAEHSGAVCALSAGPNSENGAFIASGSWDHTSRVWDGQKCLAALVGHSASVWTTAFIANLVITGSADKTIKLWTYGPSVECKLTLSGHNDCVRGLAVISESNFLSCSNDATVRLWSIKGEAIAVFTEHQNYIYSITFISNTEGIQFATCSEDRTVRIWRNNKCEQTLTLPPQTLWSLTCLTNRDLVVAGSDGKAYVFTRDDNLKAGLEELKAFEEELAKSVVHLSDIGDIKVNELPGIESLYTPGIRDGQTKLVRNGNLVSAHQWVAIKNEWIKIGDVVGSAGSSGSQKQMFEGKEYDYVFSIDIEDDKPPLKLPYNVAEDPWTVAQQFIDKHNLSQLYLEQIANFIMKNSEGIVLSDATNSNEYCDPFTGASRYAPDSNHSSNNTANISHVNQYFPHNQHLKFESINIDGIVRKLKEFSEHIPPEMRLTNSDIQLLLKLTDLSLKVEPKQIALIKMMLSWPKGYIFPALDLIRVSLLLPQVNEELCAGKDCIRLIDTLLVCANDTNSTPNQLLALRALSNIFSNPVGESLVLTHGSTIIKALSKFSSANKNIQIALSTLFLNFSVSFFKDPLNNSPLKLECLIAVITYLSANVESEAQFRNVVTIGTLAVNDHNIIEFLKNEDFISLIKALSVSSKLEKLEKSAKQLLDLIK